MNDTERTRLETLLDLLADEVASRLAERSEPRHPELLPASPAAPAAGPMPTAPPNAPLRPVLAPPDPDADQSAEASLPLTTEPEPDRAPEPASAPPSRAAALMARLALGLLLIVVLINLPLNRGAALARSVPNATSLVIANGLLVKESNSPQVWVYRDGSFHWITSLDAFQYLGYRWQDVHIVEPGFLKQFPSGNALSVLLKCDGSPDIYLLDAGRKRWIVDIPTFLAQGYVWQDVTFVSCSYLHDLPDGDSIPPGRGVPLPPLP